MPLAEILTSAANALDLRFDWYVEPTYEYNFGRAREQSLGVTGGRRISLPSLYAWLGGQVRLTLALDRMRVLAKSWKHARCSARVR